MSVRTAFFFALAALCLSVTSGCKRRRRPGPPPARQPGPPPARQPAPAQQPAPQPQPETRVEQVMEAGWELLGERNVDFKAERDVITVAGNERRFTRIQLRVKNRAVKLHDLKVTFGNGQTFDVQVRKVFQKGEHTRAIDLPGGARRIRRVAMVYDSVDRGRNQGRSNRGKAHVRLFGFGGQQAAAQPAPPPAAEPVQEETVQQNVLQPGNSGSAASRQGTWEFLGERKVDFKVDRDVISVTSSEGRFRRIQIRVKGRAIKIHDLKVTFGNGETFDVQVRKEFKAGEQTRAIDLPGGDRVIRRVAIVYDSVNRGRGRGQGNNRGKGHVRLFAHP